MTAPGTDCDVLVCGMGPVGQLLANLLGTRGVRVIALDAAAGPHGLPRAAVMDDEVLRILQSVGVDEAVLAHAQVQPAISYVTASGVPLEVLHPTVGALGHHPLVSFHQPTLEGVLVDALSRLPSVEVRWGQRLETLDQRAEHVRAWVRPVAGGRAEEISAQWLVACDGGASAVRGLLATPFAGSTFAQRWLVVDALVDRPLRKVPHPHFVGDPQRPIVSLPMCPGRHRWEWMIHPSESPAPFLDRIFIRDLMDRWLDGESAEIERAVVYTFHARMAARWRTGRTFLAGDAAHVMPPFAGQGFASGARDAGNLAWKLHAVLDGAPEGLLDTYELERLPHAAAMQKLAVQWGALVQTTRPRAARVRDRLLTAINGSSPQRWLEGHMKPLPTYSAGAFGRRPSRLPTRRSVGAMFPQADVVLRDGERHRLDDVLPAGWSAVSIESRARATFEAAGIPGLQIGAEVQDTSGALAAWFDRHGATWAVLRPDRFVFDCGAGSEAGSALASMRRLLGDSLRPPVAPPRIGIAA